MVVWVYVGVNGIYEGTVLPRQIKYRPIGTDSSCFGLKNFKKYLEKYNVSLGEEYEDIGYYNKRQWVRFMNENNKDLVSQEFLDLIDRLLRYDHQERLTAKEAMKHAYFDPIRVAVS